ncbi:MAG TPA: MMPL family transporter [Solirubrobacterales bacterium]|jgi:RND superfamily putative drug exporter|nr:MMPL family transporter [Solirubrobacterales bacterium]
MHFCATWITGHRKTVIISWIVALVGIGMLASSVGADFAEEFKLPASDSKEAFDLLEDKFPAQSGTTIQIAFKADGGVESPAVQRKMEAAFEKIEGFPHVSEVASPYEEGGAAAISENGKIAYATVQFDVFDNKLDKDKTREIIDLAQAPAGDGLDVQLGGTPVQEAEAEEGDSSFGIGLLAAMVVLLLTFGSVVAMGLPILTALFALGVGISLVTIGTHVFDTANFAPILAAMIGLGVGVDYALFILTRFRNGLDEGLEKRDAAIKAVNTAGRAVLFAGLTVIISLLGMFLLGLSFLYGVAMAAALAVLFTMIAALTLLPALLTIAGNWVNRIRIPGLGRGSRSIDEAGWWFRWSRRIQRRPVLAALLSGGFLLILCIPTLSLRLGTNDAGTEPTGKTTRQAYDLLAEGFGPGFNGPFVMVASLPGKGEDQALVRLKKQLEGEEGVAATTAISLNPAENTGVFQVYPTTSPQSADTTDLLEHIRGTVIPPLETQTGAQLHVGGVNAVFEDFGDAISEKLPLFIGVVVLLSALLLMTVFRSILVPLKAIVMNLLSIGAAFGIVVAVFQWGWGASLIGVDNTGPIISFFPIFLFAIVFGLSMDYEVFLMSRIHEEWEHTHEPTESVTRGLALTGRVITAAAIIMVTVFASFMLGDERVIKLFGLGLSSAVLLDAVVIRTVLVPAIMQLFGRSAWWFPDWLGKFLPRLHVEPGEPAPETE